MGCKSFKDLNIGVRRIECSYAYGNINDKLTYDFIDGCRKELSPYRIEVISRLKNIKNKIKYLRIFFIYLHYKYYYDLNADDLIINVRNNYISSNFVTTIKL